MRQEKTCETCSTPFRGMCNQRYCCRSCWPSEVEKVERGKQTVQCAWCGKATRSEIRPDRDVWPTCSHFCRSAVREFKQGNTSCIWPRQKKSHSGIHRPVVERVTVTKSCKVCQITFTVTCYPDSEPNCCSKRCKNRWKSIKRSAHGSTSPPSFVSGTCLDCGASFIDVYLGKMSSRYCSDQCAHRASRHRRRARARDAFIAPVYRYKIHERDRYVCYLCHKPTDPSKTVPHPRAPTLDHVIPLAKGGTHEPSNVATACFQCNCIKGDRGGGEQLMLVG